MAFHYTEMMKNVVGTPKRPNLLVFGCRWHFHEKNANTFFFDFLSINKGYLKNIPALISICPHLLIIIPDTAISLNSF